MACSPNDQQCQAVVGNHLLLKAILRNVDSRGLTKISRVNREWQSLAQNLISKRKRLGHLFYIFHVNGHRRRQEEEVEDCYNTRNDYAGKDFSDLIGYMKTQSRTLWSKPTFALLFHGNFCPHSQRVLRLLDHTVYRQYLPPQCEALSISSSVGMIGTPLSQTKSLEVQAEFTPFAGLSYLFLPKSGCEIRIFNNGDKLPEFYPTTKSHKHLKSIVMFATSSVDTKDRYWAFEEIDNLYELYEKKIALGGVVVDDIRHFKLGHTTELTKHRNEMIGLAISGEIVKAASVIFDTEYPPEMEKKLAAFKNSLDFDTNVSATHETFGLVFMCSGRGVHVFEKTNEEVGVIQKVFPNVRLSGVFGHGEYGANYWPNVPQMSEEPAIDDSETKFWHFYTTVLILIRMPLA